MKISPLFVVLLCVLLSAGGLSTSFAKPASISPSSRTSAPKLDLFKVTEKISTPGALSLSEKKMKVDTLLKAMPNPPLVNLEKASKAISMDVRHPMVEGQAFLQFDDAETVSPYNNSATMEPTKDSQPNIVVFFKPSGDGTYMFDFNLSNMPLAATPQLTFAQTLFTNVQQQTAENGDAHALFFATFKGVGTGWIPMTLQSNCFTKFFGVDITKVN